jgi:hypothetical protein
MMGKREPTEVLNDDVLSFTSIYVGIAIKREKQVEKQSFTV